MEWATRLVPSQEGPKRNKNSKRYLRSTVESEIRFFKKSKTKINKTQSQQFNQLSKKFGCKLLWSEKENLKPVRPHSP